MSTMKRGPEKQYPRRLEIRVDTDLLKRLRVLAKRHGMTVAAFIRETVRQAA